MKQMLTLLALSASPCVVQAQIPAETRCKEDYPTMNRILPAFALVLLPCLATAQSLSSVWSGYAHDPQHTATSATAAQPLNSIHWQTPIDQSAASGGNGLLFVHYGSPVITAANTVIVPTTTASGGYSLQAFNGATGAPIYTIASTYSLPPHNWTPAYGPALALGTRLFYPGPGGTLYYRDLPNAPKGPNGQAGATGQFAFYGIANYNANSVAYNNAIQISTPLTADRTGNIYFGFTAAAGNSLGLVSGLAKLSYTGAGTWVSAVSLTGDSNASEIALNCAPALSNTQSVVYVATSTGAEYGTGYLTAANASNLAPVAHIALNDPRPGTGLATVSGDSTASPLVGPDGDVYYGVLENNCCSSHNDRGWLLHFNSALSKTRVPGSFGWDDTASVVPSSAVPSYSGSSSYLLLTKYNNYINAGNGNGQNQVAILDPNATMTDLYPGPTNPAISVMQEVITVLGKTTDSRGGVKEWCINTAAIDPATKSALINSEDGTVYRWDFTSNTLLQSLNLTSGRGEAYTPTVIGPDGTVYAVNDAILFAVGK